MWTLGFFILMNWVDCLADGWLGGLYKTKHNKLDNKSWNYFSVFTYSLYIYIWKEKMNTKNNIFLSIYIKLYLKNIVVVVIINIIVFTLLLFFETLFATKLLKARRSSRCWITFPLVRRGVCTTILYTMI